LPELENYRNALKQVRFRGFNINVKKFNRKNGNPDDFYETDLCFVCHGNGSLMFVRKTIDRQTKEIHLQRGLADVPVDRYSHAKLSIAGCREHAEYCLRQCLIQV
jgi:hypothetical protein